MMSDGHLMNGKTSASTVNSLSSDNLDSLELNNIDNRYKNCKNTGVAIIFNHNYVQNFKKRVGTEKDKQRLRKVFLRYGFDVRLYDDLKREEVFNVLYRVSKEDHSKNTCLCIVVLSHGGVGELFAMDKSYAVQNLWNDFTGDKCPSLIGKPKIFIIQACRGENVDLAVNVNSLGHKGLTDAESMKSPTKQSLTIPTSADFMFVFSTFEGNLSFRNPSEGGWFIQSLCKELEKAGENGGVADLMPLLQAVLKRVAFKYQFDEKGQTFKQMPCFTSSLTKTFSLKIKEINEYYFS